MLASFVTSVLVLLGTEHDSEALSLSGDRSALAAETQLWALRLVTAAARGAPASSVAKARRSVREHANPLLATHSTMLFRDPSGPAAGASAVDSVPSGGTQSARLFEPSCLRNEARSGDCMHPEHPFRAVTRSGMHGLLLRFVSGARSLVDQPLEQLSSGPGGSGALLLVWTAGQFDLRDGLEASAKDPQDAILVLRSVRRLADSLALLGLLAAVIAIHLLLVQPFIKRISAETQRAAKMVSLLPPEVDVRKLLPRRRGATARRAAPATGAGAGGRASGRRDGGHGAMSVSLGRACMSGEGTGTGWITG